MPMSIQKIAIRYVIVAYYAEQILVFTFCAEKNG